MKTIQEIFNNRKIFGGENDRFISHGKTKYPWQIPMIQKFEDNLWTPNEVKNLEQDKIEFLQLPKAIQYAYKLNLARVSNLDSIQLDNLGLNIMPYVTDNCTKTLLNDQMRDEQIHTKSYLRLLQNVVNNGDEVEILHKTVPELMAVNDDLEGEMFNGEKVTPEKFALMIVNNVLLEGLLFFYNFAWFYNLNNATGKMQGTKTMIQYINKDEQSHFELFCRLFDEHTKEWKIDKQSLLPEIENRVKHCLQQEINWGVFVNKGGENGLTDGVVKGFLEYRAKLCLDGLGYFTHFLDAVENPLLWFDSYTGNEINQTSVFQSQSVDYIPVAVSLKKTLNFNDF